MSNSRNLVTLLIIICCGLSYSQTEQNTKSYKQIDSTLALGLTENYSGINRLLWQISLEPFESAQEKFDYLKPKISKNDSLLFYFYQHQLSTFLRVGQPQKALLFSDEGIKIARELKSDIISYEVFQLRANIYTNLSNTDSALYYINRSEKIIVKNERLRHKMARVFYQRAIIANTLDDPEEEDAYMEKIAEVVLKNPSKKMTYNFSIVVYHFKNRKNFEKHAYYSQKFQEYLIKKDVTKIPEKHVSYASMLEFEDTATYIKELKSILEGDDYLAYDFYKIQLANQIGQGLMALNRYDEAIDYFKTSLNYNKDDVNIFSKLISHNSLYKSYLKINNYKDAVRALDDYMLVQNKIRDQETINKVAELNVQFDSEKKQAQIELLDSENKAQTLRSRQYATLAIFGLLFTFLIGYFAFKITSKNKKLNSQKALLESTLDEKNTLLKEVHHRVKNSFQIVSSLLYLQAETIEDQEAKLAIKEAQNRVRSMVLIHQKLYNRDELVGINTKDYFNDLVKDIFESHQTIDRNISYNLNIEPIILDVETITPIGLILNELIINTLKHAFKTVSEANNLRVNFNKQNDQLVLSVGDNGVGLKSEVKSSSFGIKLMKALSKKLKATLNYNSNPGEGTMAVLSINRYTIVT
ncbi:histidine kinase dimerization/phosphoacceptor domain -containing protein [Winogradskyella maritima]|uniref:histidine kinase n=1 Tax=Winogradskyella maritima TaxID=1517766 RepID=A0ABV8AGJ3_9FLAO|nr:histidine kinase dimerization/phosphoacceptor domain -containing protein [Winogradskyella maritima]